jgi:hypothetical protein
VNHWVTEAAIQHDPTFGYRFVIPGSQETGDAVAFAHRLVDELEYVENCLVFGSKEHGLSMNTYRTSEHETLLEETACILVEKSRMPAD